MLHGNYVGLRAIEDKDLQTLLEWRNDPQLRKHFREYRELNSTQQNDWFMSKVNNDPGTRMFSIVDLESTQLLGACGLCYIDWVNRSADFSIYLGKDASYIDEKYAPDAASVLINYAFSELALHRLWSEIYAFDQKKIAFFNSLDFKLDGTHRETHWSNGQWHDSLFFSKLASKSTA
jgi:RimJ/RimL family protein N-acetyltransferase